MPNDQRPVHDARDIKHVMQKAWRPTRCPMCNTPMVRDLTVTDHAVYPCTRCGVHTHVGGCDV